tara:strand:- start:721 stop:1293 length:573 start_codon:yes stop_codon:yes gene_type:complete
MNNILIIIIVSLFILSYLSNSTERFTDAIVIPAGMIAKTDLPMDMADNLFKKSIQDEQDSIHYISRANLIKATHSYCAYTRAVGSTLGGALMTLCVPLSGEEDGEDVTKYFSISCCCLDAFCAMYYGDAYYFVKHKDRYYLAKSKGESYDIVQYIEECNPENMPANGLHPDTELPCNMNMKKLGKMCSNR